MKLKILLLITVSTLLGTNGNLDPKSLITETIKEMYEEGQIPRSLSPETFSNLQKLNTTGATDPELLESLAEVNAEANEKIDQFLSEFKARLLEKYLDKALYEAGISEVDVTRRPLAPSPRNN